METGGGAGEFGAGAGAIGAGAGEFGAGAGAGAVELPPLGGEVLLPTVASKVTTVQDPGWSPK
jgi:hypothetical protein